MEQQQYTIIIYGENFIPVIYVDHLIHTKAYPFCWDITCPCHQDLEALAQVAQAHEDGLCTTEEAKRIMAGRQF